MKKDKQHPAVLDQYLQDFHDQRDGCEWYAKNLRFWAQLRHTKEFEDIIDLEFKQTLVDKYESDLKDAVMTVNRVIEQFGWDRPPIKSVPTSLAELILLLDEASAYMLWLIDTIRTLPYNQPKE